MKTTIKSLAILLMTGTFFFSCQKDNNFPNDSLKDTFNNKFPNAKGIEWEVEKGYYVADFRENGREKEAWFEKSGIWLLTETDYERKAPDVIKKVLDASEYNSWRIDDVDFIEQKDKVSFFIVEIEKGEKEMDLFFSENGELIEEVQGNGDYRPLPW